MNRILGKIDKENKIGYLMGDFNIDLLKSESCDYTSRFLEQMFTSSFFPLILRPTSRGGKNILFSGTATKSGKIFCELSTQILYNLN